MRLAVLTGGGDVPGLNPCIKALVTRVEDAGHEVAGVRRGWAGLLECNPDDETSIEAWCEYMAELAGIEARFERTEHTIGGIPTDNTLRRELVGPTSVAWKDGFRRMVEAQTQGRASGA